MAQSEVWTIGRLLQWTADYLKQHGSESPRLDAEVLLSHAAGCERIALYTRFDEEPEERVRGEFRQLVRRRAEGRPVAYLVGYREFYSMTFEVTPDVLIPRPETEFVVIEVLDLLKQPAFSDSPVRMADVGTGSGIIAVTVARHAPQCRVTALDINPVALAVAAAHVQDRGTRPPGQQIEGGPGLHLEEPGAHRAGEPAGVGVGRGLDVGVLPGSVQRPRPQSFSPGFTPRRWSTRAWTRSLSVRIPTTWPPETTGRAPYLVL